MAVGDLITGNYQYEWRGILLGSGTKYVTTKWTGLLIPPEINNKDSERQDAWGTFPGRDLYKDREFTCDISIDGTSGADAEAALFALTSVFIIDRKQQPYQFVLQRPNGLGKRFLWAKPSRADFPGDADLAHGLAVGSLAWIANDPRFYSLVEHADQIIIANGTVTNNANITNSGTVSSAPILEINGPCTNPRVANAADNNRQIKVDVVVPAGQLLSVDLKARTVTLNGGDASAYVRPDNQWWTLQAGVNPITYSRTDNGAASTLNVRHRDAWIQ